MRLAGKNMVRIEEGDIIPVYCRGCREIYTPPGDSEVSRCPCCGTINEHVPTWKVAEDLELN